MNNSGGVAVNSGINYQQRVAAWFLASMILEVEASFSVDLDASFTIDQVSYETSSCIDDLEVLCSNNKRLLMQVKRTVNLSTTAGSDFVKTMSQFVKQYLVNSSLQDSYLLVTSNTSSLKVVRELKKILISIRLNDNKFAQNPLNQSEQDTFKKFRKVIKDLFKINNVTYSEEVFIEFCKKVYVSLFDIEQGESLEKAIILCLGQKTVVNPQLVWELLISKSLTLSANRQSITRDAILKTLNKYLTSEPEVLVNDTNQDNILVSLENPTFSVDKEVILVEMNEQEVWLIELPRFDAEGNKIISFFEDKCKIPHKEDLVPVIYRTATMVGMERLLSENFNGAFSDKKLIIAPSTYQSSDNPYAKVHSELLGHIARANSIKTTCIHCGKSISTSDALVVEIDETNLPHQLGLVHKECLRSVDRVLGIVQSELFNKYHFLKNFDYKTWIKNIDKSQMLIANVKETNIPRIVEMLWNSNHEYDATYGYCIRITLVDGSCEYVTQRGQVVRLTKEEAYLKSTEMKEAFQKARWQKDKFCYTSKTRAFGTYSTLVRIMKEDEKTLECKDVEVQKYTDVVGKAFNKCNNYYAPLLYLTCRLSEEIFEINKHIIMLSNPLKLDDYIENWTNAGIDVGDYEVNIISNDLLFDNKIRKFFRQGYKVIIDPFVDNNRSFVRGIKITDINKVLG